MSQQSLPVFIANLGNSNNPVAILSLNCQSISSKFDDSGENLSAKSKI